VVTINEPRADLGEEAALRARQGMKNPHSNPLPVASLSVSPLAAANVCV
jgi:hypothetical protein